MRFPPTITVVEFSKEEVLSECLAFVVEKTRKSKELQRRWWNFSSRTVTQESIQLFDVPGLVSNVGSLF